MLLGLNLIKGRWGVGDGQRLCSQACAGRANSGVEVLWLMVAIELERIVTCSLQEGEIYWEH